MLRIGSNKAEDNNKLFFKNDDEFYKFCVVPELIIVEPESENDVYSTTWEFSNDYKKALEDGKIFVIKDEDSLIFKRGAVSYRTITKNVDNLEQYFSDIDGN